MNREQRRMAKRKKLSENQVFYPARSINYIAGQRVRSKHLSSAVIGYHRKDREQANG